MVDSRDGAYPYYYANSSRCDNLRDILLFRLLEKLFDALKFFNIYNFAPHLGTDAF